MPTEDEIRIWFRDLRDAFGPDPVREMNAAKLHPIDASPGFFKVQMTRGGAFLPARLWCEPQLDSDGQRIADDRYFAEIGTDLVNPYEPPLWGAWIKIAPWEWEHLYHDLVWCLANDRTKPIANPTIPAARAPRELF